MFSNVCVCVYAFLVTGNWRLLPHSLTKKRSADKRKLPQPYCPEESHLQNIVFFFFLMEIHLPGHAYQPVGKCV